MTDQLALTAIAPAAILVVEDEATIGRLLQRGLVLEGHQVQVATSGRAALAAIRDRQPDLIVLDLTLPDMDGLDVCRRVRALDAVDERSSTPILILTARDAVSDRVTGLEAGADDYLGKPFHVDELIARVRALLRRARVATSPAAPTESLSLADLRLDPRSRTAFRGVRQLQLTTREFDLLTCLLRHANQVMSQDAIMSRVWGSDYYGESNVLAVVIASLRNELECGGEPRLIQTVRGIGYVMRLDEHHRNDHPSAVSG